jgi:hypothetical protein
MGGQFSLLTSHGGPASKLAARILTATCFAWTSGRGRSPILSADNGSSGLPSAKSEAGSTDSDLGGAGCFQVDDAVVNRFLGASVTAASSRRLSRTDPPEACTASTIVWK